MAASVLEKYRRAAMQLRSEGTPVTKAELARKLQLSPPTVITTVNRQDWRRQYVGVIASADVTRRKYQEAAIRLNERGLAITKAGLACELGIQPRSVQFYFRHHPDVLLVIGLSLARVLPAPARYREAVASLRAKGVPVVRKNLAEELGIGFSGVCEYLRKRPAFARELGLD